MKHHQITASMAKDIAFKLGAELNNEEAEIFADGYNAAMLKVNKNASTELPNDANLSTSSQAEPDDSGLLPCPFCGSPAEHYPDGDMEGYIIMCGNKNGDCNLQTFGFTTPEEAEKAWNTRAAIPQTGNFRENPISSTNNFRKIADTSTNSPVTPDGWISCSERMPEDEQEVIVQNKLGYRYVSYFDEHSGLFFDMRGGNQINCIEHILVTHWRPMPVPPQH
ncbi:DUF551 domain-containing protein [Salmonella enterica subsp. enterica serovar Montevideo]|uniref:DUF551 domain-containing protein n=1 Tax=Salmonella enterica TaxID=28901 RepID=A0A5Y4QCT3_SALER|nr:DUF551 domain-containing protein [Salmonella enterica]EAQ1051835.1 DUF551 domain-containing protein [Salmonella enterica subsp. enterica serovar Cerro]EAV8216457.1 DUF551 domain-containing protein [Salmonella enterica subsp. enterica]EAX5777762.1 DUF551 domain-containing protein [Salmonella enterica subsp. enterica serovar Senftenberg]EAX7989645.1 DUF551 domain-containing protein [Salmonella enterica subsp. enterica serovar Lille]EBB4010103.1 DUF551 domain-containing protein [Salmonella ent